MESNHKDLLDQVINEANTTEIPVTEGEETQEEESIQEKIERKKY